MHVILQTGWIMRTSMVSQFRDLLPAWFVCVLAPAPAILVAKSGSAALMYYFVACAALVAYAFRHDVAAGLPDSDNPPLTWRRRMISSALALFAAWCVFAVICQRLQSQHAQVATWLSLLILAPCLGIVPYMARVTRQPFAAVVFSVSLVTLVKLAGCVIVVLVYGWDADEFGHTNMPWTRPNLLVWCFLIGTAILSAACFFLGARQSQSALSLNTTLDA
jgi:hypothetical protein